MWTGLFTSQALIRMVRELCPGPSVLAMCMSLLESLEPAWFDADYFLLDNLAGWNTSPTTRWTSLLLPACLHGNRFCALFCIDILPHPHVDSQPPGTCPILVATPTPKSQVFWLVISKHAKLFGPVTLESPTGKDERFHEVETNKNAHLHFMSLSR